MKSETDILKPIHMLAVLCAAIAGIAFVGFCFAGNLSGGSNVIIFSIFAWNLLAAAGVWIRSPWGYYALKCYLYVLLLAFPFGTIISWNVLRHIKEHSLKKLFIRTSLESFKLLAK